jgi:hypothetical protein
LRKLLKEPLVHFLAAGVGLFVLFGIVNRDEPEDDPNVVVVDRDALLTFVQYRIKAFNPELAEKKLRALSDEELELLIDDYVREEVLHREALALGLDQNDLVIRRRMRQKMEFLNADLSEQRTPSEAELQAYLDGHADKFRRPARLSFEQIYVAGGENPQAARHKAENLLTALANPATDWQRLGDPTLLPAGLNDASDADINATFGRDLAGSVTHAPLNRWSGPHRSAYGLHLLRVTERRPARLPALGEIRALVEREWRNEQRRRSNERFYQGLRERYTVEIQLPDADSADKVAVRRP